MNLEDRKLFEEAERRMELVQADDRAIRQRMYRARYKGEVVSPVRGFYARKEWFEGLPKESQVIAKAKALHITNPDWVFSGATAAVIHGLPIPPSRMDDLGHISPGRKKAQGKDRTPHRPPFKKRDRFEPTKAIVNGLPVTSLEETVFECTRSLDFRQGLAVCDCALKKSGLGKEEFARRVLSFRIQGKRGSWKTEYPLDYMDARSGSVAESIARAIMIENLYQLPELQVDVRGLFKRNESYRVDFLWLLPDGTRVAGEYSDPTRPDESEGSGGMKDADSGAEAKKRARRRRSNGVTLMRFGPMDLLSDRRFCGILDEYGIPCEGRRTGSMALKEAA